MMNKLHRSVIIGARNQRFSPESLRQNPLRAVRSFTDDIDMLLGEVFTGHFDTRTKKVCLTALGGYGRRELCPWSDIDLLILHKGDHTHEDIARFVRALWDVGLPLGCVVRSISECKKIIGEDLATDTALLDARYVMGSLSLFRSLQSTVINPYFHKRKKWFTQEIETAISASIEAAEISLYTVEPDLKEGICTLRDCHRIRWALKVTGGNSIDFDGGSGLFLLEKGETLIREAFHTLLSIRSALHVAAQRRIDVLEFGFQPRIAEMLGLGKDNPELLMERYFRTVRDVKVAILLYFEQKRESRPLLMKIRSSLSSIQVIHGIRLLDGILWEIQPDTTQQLCNGAWLMDLFRCALSYQATFSTDLLVKLRSYVGTMNRDDFINVQVHDHFIALLSSRTPIEPVIRIMHETGVLEKMIPEFESIRCKVEYDSYHEFTVDQHTMLALYTFDELKNDPEYAKFYDEVNDRCTLRLAILLHDIGKSLEGNHCYNGAVMVGVICDRLEIDEKRKNDVITLVYNHLELSKLTFQREPEINILQSFSKIMGTVTMLDMLYLLTIVDIRSVGKKSWTGWKGVQLQSVYEKTKMLLDGKVPATGDLEPLIGCQIKTMADGIRSRGDLAIELELFHGYDRLTFCAIDRHRLFADIVGCISSEGYNILNAQIMTTSDKKAIDIFTVEPDTVTSTASAKRIANIRKKWDKIISGESDADSFIARYLRMYPPKTVRKPGNKTASAEMDNTISEEYSVIELHTIDCIGLLYKIALVFSRLEINIVSAKLSTRGTNIADVFYVNTTQGFKIEQARFDKKIRYELLQQLG